MKLRFQIGSNRPLANRKARMFSAASLPRKWSIRKIWSLVERLVQRGVERAALRQVGAEGLLHDDFAPARRGPPRRSVSMTDSAAFGGTLR